MWCKVSKKKTKGTLGVNMSEVPFACFSNLILTSYL